MAMMIRNTHRLLTIRIDLNPGRSGGLLQFTTFRGTERLTSLEIAAEAAGIRPELSVRAYQSASFHLPADLIEALARSVLDRAQVGEPIWLQVGPSGGHLAVVPWERLFQPVLNRPLLRIPNFLADPVFLTGPLRLGLVLSSPRAKTAFPIETYAGQFLQTVQAALPQGTEVDVFADLDAYSFLKGIPSSSLHRVVIHDPRQSEVFGDGGTNTAPAWRGNLESPWLRWMADALRGRSLDAVHFVCPGFFRRDQGALAVARSPAENVDREWSHMIGAGELMAFLDIAGAWAVAFTPSFEDVWAMGVRLLADRLAWQRPGALLVHQWSPDSASLADGYRFLFADHDAPAPRTPSLMVYAHPKRMARYRGSMTSYEAKSALGIRTGPEGEVPEQLEWLARKNDREAQRGQAPLPDAPWKRTAQLQLDQMLVRLGDEDSPERRGALDALARVRSILESES